MAASRADQIFERFKKFHESNPRVWEMFKRFANEAISSGRSHYSANGIFERMRWHVDIETKDLQFKLSNDYRAYYARLFHVAYPDLNGFFSVRDRPSKNQPAFDDPNYIADTSQEELDFGLEEKLKALLNNEEIK